MTTKATEQATTPTTVRLPEDLRRRLARLAVSSKRSVNSVIAEMLEESVRMRRIPGILFADEPTGRQPWIAGTGLEVAEFAAIYVRAARNAEKVKENFDLSDPQIRAGLAYWEAYPGEIDRRLAEDEAFDEEAMEAVYREFPFMRPPHLRPA